MHGPTAIGETDNLGAAVAGVGNALRQAKGLHVGHELPHRLLGHHRPLRQLGDARAAGGMVNMDEDAHVRRAQADVAGLAEGAVALPLHRQRRRPQQLADHPPIRLRLIVC